MPLKEKSKNIQLLAIDPQNDFCDLPAAYRPTGHAPSLPVAGAHADMQRLAAFIRAHAAGLDGITVTLDSHQRFDIAHPGFWQQAGGGAAAPFTPITAAQVRAGAFAPRNAAASRNAATNCPTRPPRSRTIPPRIRPGGPTPAAQRPPGTGPRPPRSRSCSSARCRGRAHAV